MVPGWDPDNVAIQALEGGLTNRSYRVRFRNSDYVLRLEGIQRQPFQFDRSLEERVMATAEAAGIGPSMSFSDPVAGVLLREFLPGRAWRQADLEITENLEALADLLRCCHELPLTGVSMRLSDHATIYKDVLRLESELHSFALKCIDIVDNAGICDDRVCAHNDIVAANVIDHGNLKLIDWEYACDNDPMFDLASAIGYHNLDVSQADILLNAYLGGGDAAWRERLDAQIRVYDAIHWLWLAARYRESPTHEQVQRLELLRLRLN